MSEISPLNPRTETVIILQGEDDETLRRLKAEVERTAPKKGQASPVTTLDEPDAHEAAKRAHDEFAAEAETRGVRVVLRALGRKTWASLREKHKPREGNAQDQEAGADLDALQEELVPLCIASPVGSIEEIGAFLDSLSEGQYGDLAIRAWSLNMGRTADPTQRLLSGVSRT